MFTVHAVIAAPETGRKRAPHPNRHTFVKPLATPLAMGLLASYVVSEHNRPSLNNRTGSWVYSILFSAPSRN
jgi:hypothetical protein